MVKKQPSIAFALLLLFPTARNVRAQEVAALIPPRRPEPPRPQLESETQKSARGRWDTTHAQLHYLPPEYTPDPSLLQNTTILPWAFAEQSLDKWFVLGEPPCPVPTSLFPVNPPEDAEFVCKLR